MAKSKSKFSSSALLIPVVLLALLGGFIGAQLGSGDSSSASAGSDNGAWIEKIKESGELRVGVAEAAPMTTMTPKGGGPAGGPMTLPMQHLADELGVKYVPVATTWANIVAGLQADRYDVAAYLDNTLERAISIQFTDPVLTYQAVLVVPADSPYSSSTEVIESKKPIALGHGTAYTNRLKALGAQLLEVDTLPNGLAALKADRAVAWAVDLAAAEGAVQEDPSLKIIVPDPVIYQSGSGFGVSNDIDARSLQLLNLAILDAKDYGDLSTAFSEVGFREIDALGDWQKK